MAGPSLAEKRLPQEGSKVSASLSIEAMDRERRDYYKRGLTSGDDPESPASRTFFLLEHLRATGNPLYEVRIRAFEEGLNDRLKNQGLNEEEVKEKIRTKKEEGIGIFKRAIGCGDRPS